MSDEKKAGIDRRRFLKTAAVSAGVAGAAPAITLAQAAEAPKSDAPTKGEAAKGGLAAGWGAGTGTSWEPADWSADPKPSSASGDNPPPAQPQPTELRSQYGNPPRSGVLSDPTTPGSQ